MVILLMGVSGSGKTTIGEKLAEATGWTFCDGDALHSPANIAKMSAGTPLADADRAPWLATIRSRIEGWLARNESAIVACSALREKYRTILVVDPARVKIVCLWGEFDLLARRMHARRGHFMKENMLRSQFETLERPPNALLLNVAETPDTIVAQIQRELVP